MLWSSYFSNFDSKQSNNNLYIGDIKLHTKREMTRKFLIIGGYWGIYRIKERGAVNFYNATHFHYARYVFSFFIKFGVPQKGVRTLPLDPSLLGATIVQWCVDW